MSLINDMLRDLEQRRKQEAQQGPVSAPTPVNRKPVGQRLMLTVGALALLLLLLLAAGWAYYLPKPFTPDVEVAKVAPTDSEEALNLLPLEITTPATPALKVEPVALIHPLLTSVNLVEDDLKLQLELAFDQLPARAEIRSRPQEGQVLIRLPDTYLQQSLVIPQPQNDQIRNISLVPTSAGLDLIVTVAAGQQIATSQRLEPLASMLYIGLEFPVEIISAVDTDTEVTDKAPITAVAEPVMAVAPPNPAAAITQVVSPTLIRSQPLVETDEQLYQRGLQQVRQGDRHAARENLSAALRMNPELLPARLELIGVLQQLAEESQALRVIQDGLRLNPGQPELRKLVAHSLLSLQQHQAALTQLDADPVPAVAADPDYHALRAAIYQEVGEYAQAAQLYARLLEQRPREPLWWLGLAIALEQQGLATGARDAYRTALDVSGLRPDLERFVQERLQQL